MASSADELPSYPKPFQASPGNELSSLAALGVDAFADQHGFDLIVAGRFPDGLKYLWAPVELITYGACSCSLVETTPEFVRLHGNFLQEEAAAALDGRKSVIVCAPPLAGPHAFLLVDLAWKEARLLETAIGSLESLAISASWSPDRAASATAELFQKMSKETHQWWNSTSQIAVAHPRANWRVYTGADDDEFATNLTRAIQKFARRPTDIVHRFLPAPETRIVDGLSKIAALAAGHEDRHLLARAVNTILTHPESMASIVSSAPALLTGLESLDTSALVINAMTTLDHLYHEELLSVEPSLNEDSRPPPIEAKIRLDSPFVFTLESAHAFAQKGLGCPDHLWDVKTATENLDTYLGGYLDQLDLSKSYITGSAAMSSVLRPPQRGLFATQADFLASYYPAVYTRLDDPAALRYRITHHTWKFREVPFVIEEVDEGPADATEEVPAIRRKLVWPSHDQEYEYTLHPGADVDIAVDAEGEEFDRVAALHYKAVQSRFPSATLVRVDRERSHMYRIVSAAALGSERGFREVEIYPASWREICTHHVGMVRLAYTGAADAASGGAEAKTPRFHLTASCVKSAVECGTPNYYFFASRKTSPQEIMLKYAARGYPPKFLPRSLASNVRRYARKSPRWNPENSYSVWDWNFFTQNPPAISCQGNYNVENLLTEIRAYGHEEAAPEEEQPSDEDA